MLANPAKRAKAIETDRQRLLMAKALKTDRMNEVPVFGPPQFQDLSPVMNVREIEERMAERPSFLSQFHGLLVILHGIVQLAPPSSVR